MRSVCFLKDNLKLKGLDVVSLFFCFSIPALTKEEAQEAFNNFANSNCCYSSGPATDGVITNMEQFNTYRVTAITHILSREMLYRKNKLGLYCMYMHCSVQQAFPRTEDKSDSVHFLVHWFLCYVQQMRTISKPTGDIIGC